MKKSLLTLAAISLLGLAACNGTPASSSEGTSSEATTSQATTSEGTSSQETVTAAITNKEELAAEWHLGDADRAIGFNLAPQCNILEALADGRLVIQSSNPEVVSILGRNLHANAVGTVTITVTYLEKATDTVEIEVLDMLGEPDFALATLSDVMAIPQEDLTPSGSNFYYNKAFMTRVKVEAIGNKKDGSAAADKYGNMWVSDPLVENDAEIVQVYGSGASAKALVYDSTLPGYKYANEKDYLDNEDTKGIKVGDMLDVIAIRADYNTTKEISFVIRAINGKLVSNGSVTTDDVIATPDSFNVRTQLVTVSGVITGWAEGKEDATKYGNFFIKTEESNGEPVYVYGASASTTWEKTEESGTTIMDTIQIGNDGALKFNNPKDFLTNEGTKDLKIGDKISLLGFRCDYKGTIELTGIVEKYVEPAKREDPVDASIADLLAKTAPESDKTYKLTGVWENPKGDKYGNGYLTDPLTGDSITVYGLTATASAIAFDGSTGTPFYKFTNPADYLDNDATKNLKAGQVITVEAINAYYAAKSLPEVTCVLLEAGEVTDAKFGVTVEAGEGGQVNVSKTADLAYGEEVTVEAAPVEGYELKSLKIVDAFGTAKDIVDGKFKATCVNKVVAEFVEQTEGVRVSKTVEKLAEDLGWANSEAHNDFALDEIITITHAGGNGDSKYYTNGQNWRNYFGKAGADENKDKATFTVSAATGYEIVSVAMTFTTKGPGMEFDLVSGEAKEVGAASVVLNAKNTDAANTNQILVTAFEVVYVAVN